MGVLLSRRAVVLVAVLVLAGLAGTLVVALTGGGHARAAGAGAVPVGSTISVDPSTDETFAPPAAGVSPVLSAAQAYLDYQQSVQEQQTGIPPDVAVRLGLLTMAVGPYCGDSCQSHALRDGIYYRALDELAYGYSWSVCPAGSALPAVNCLEWIFVDADSGRTIDQLGPAPTSPSSEDGGGPPSP